MISKKTQTAMAVGEVVRAKARDVAYTYRMGAGFPGDVNRAHPFSIEPTLLSTAVPVAAYGLGVVVDPANNRVRGVQPGDTGITRLYGVAVRPFPTQQTTGGMNSALGDAPVNTTQPLDVLRFGYFMARVNGTARKGDPAFLWCAASAGSDVQGGFRTTASAGNTAALTNVFFNGPADASGVAELVIVM